MFKTTEFILQEYLNNRVARSAGLNFALSIKDYLFGRFARAKALKGIERISGYAFLLDYENKSQFISSYICKHENLRRFPVSDSVLIDSELVIEKFLYFVDKFEPRLRRDRQFIHTNCSLLRAISNERLRGFVCYTTYNLPILLVLKLLYPEIRLHGVQHGVTVRTESFPVLNPYLGFDMYLCWHQYDVDYYAKWYRSSEVECNVTTLRHSMIFSSFEIRNGMPIHIMNTPFKNYDYLSEIRDTATYLHSNYGALVTYNFHPMYRRNIIVWIGNLFKMGKLAFSYRREPPSNSALCSNGSSALVEYKLKGFNVFQLNRSSVNMEYPSYVCIEHL